MSNNPLWYDAAVDGVTGHASVSLNTGTIEIRTGAQPALDAALTGTLLATLTFNATAFGASSGGTATAGAITSGTAGNTGTAQYFALKTSGGTVVMTGTCGSPSGFDLNMSTTAIVAGAVVSCSAFTVVG